MGIKINKYLGLGYKWRIQRKDGNEEKRETRKTGINLGITWVKVSQNSS